MKNIQFMMKDNVDLILVAATSNASSNNVKFHSTCYKLIQTYS